MLLVAPAQRHRGAPLIPLLCRLRSADVLSFHLENCDKGNTPKVYKEEKEADIFLFFLFLSHSNFTSRRSWRLQSAQDQIQFVKIILTRRDLV